MMQVKITSNSMCEKVTCNENDSTIQIHKTKVGSRRITLPGMSVRWDSSFTCNSKTEIPLTYPKVSEDFGFLLKKTFSIIVSFGEHPSNSPSWRQSPIRAHDQTSNFALIFTLSVLGRAHWRISVLSFFKPHVSIEYQHLHSFYLRAYWQRRHTVFINPSLVQYYHVLP
jgi:hypothetical protein